MKQSEPSRIGNLLQGVPTGGLSVVPGDASGRGQDLPEDAFFARTDGTGRIETYSVLPGVHAAYALFLASQVTFRHQTADSVLEVFYCRAGRVGWNMRNGTAVYLGAGDLAVHSAACCGDSAMLFPLGYAEGISIAVDLPALEAACPEILREAGLDFRALQAALCTGTSAAVPACPELEAIFAPLFSAASPQRRAYLHLKVQELLLYLANFRPSPEALAQYDSQQTELIREIQRQLTEHPDRRFTIEALARQYHINTSTLKTVFKAVYGLPIATYMKEYRVKLAMKLLRDTDAPISEIAGRVGYRTQGKFSEAFRDVTRMLPTEYRKGNG